MDQQPQSLFSKIATLIVRLDVMSVYDKASDTYKKKQVGVELCQPQFSLGKIPIIHRLAAY